MNTAEGACSGKGESILLLRVIGQFGTDHDIVKEIYKVVVSQFECWGGGGGGGG